MLPRSQAQTWVAWRIDGRRQRTAENYNLQIFAFFAMYKYSQYAQYMYKYSQYAQCMYNIHNTFSFTIKVSQYKTPVNLFAARNVRKLL